MSFLDVSLEDVPELQAVEEGEYEVQITKAELGTSEKSGGQYILLRLEIPSISESKDLTHVMMLPKDGDTEKQKIKSLGRLKEAMEAFGYDYASAGGIDTEALQGRTAWAYLVVEETAEYGEQNNIKKFTKAK